MAKIDLLNAYRHVPVHRADYHLLGLEWEGRSYCGKALHFGLHLAPKLFPAVADSLAWAMECKGVQNSLHYLDNLLFWGPPASPSCELVLSCTTVVFQAGPPGGEPQDCWANHNTHLPRHRDKLACLKATLARWVLHRRATKHELQVLIGQLNHAATVVHPGHSFMRQLTETMKIPCLQYQRVQVNYNCRANLAWGSMFI